MKQIGTDTATRIRARSSEVAGMLVAKNAAYGDSALRPVSIFSPGRASDLIRVRIDDKLSRIKNSPEAFGEDPIFDLLGYLILRTLAVEDEAGAAVGRGLENPAEED